MLSNAKPRPKLTATPLQGLALSARLARTVKVITVKAKPGKAVNATDAPKPNNPAKIATAVAKPPKPAKKPRVRKPSPERLAIRQRIIQTQAETARRYPACFALPGESKRPLAIGIAEQVFKACVDLNTHDLINALHEYTGDADYLAATIEGAARVDLNGASVGIVTQRQELWAKGRVGIGCAG